MKLLILTSLILLTGCASLPSRDSMTEQTKNYQLPLEDKAGMARVFVVRPSGLGSLIRFNVFLDNDNVPEAEMGWNRGSQRIYFYVKTGMHHVYSHAENTADLEFTAQANEVIYIKQNTDMGVFMARNTLTIIDEVEGKYFVMTTGNGEIKRISR